MFDVEAYPRDPDSLPRPVPPGARRPVVDDGTTDGSERSGDECTPRATRASASSTSPTAAAGRPATRVCATSAAIWSPSRTRRRDPAGGPPPQPTAGRTGQTSRPIGGLGWGRRPPHRAAVDAPPAPAAPRRSESHRRSWATCSPEQAVPPRLLGRRRPGPAGRGALRGPAHHHARTSLPRRFGVVPDIVYHWRIRRRLVDHPAAPSLDDLRDRWTTKGCRCPRSPTSARQGHPRLRRPGAGRRHAALLVEIPGCLTSGGTCSWPGSASSGAPACWSTPACRPRTG